jgi:hypothetical protein
MDITDNLLFCALAAFFTFAFLLSLRSLFKVIPSLADCAARWKGNLELEDSLQLSNSRNLVTIVLYVPLCMVAYSHNLYHPDYFDSLSPTFSLLACIGTGLGYLLLRSFLNWQLEMGAYHTKAFIAANRSFNNLVIILFFIIFTAGGLLRAFGAGEEASERVLLYIAAFVYFLHIVRRGQIFASACNPFTTFLYLCGLELLPTAALVLSAQLL